MEKLKIVGVGGAGASMVGTMFSKGVPGAGFIVVNRGTGAFLANPCPHKVVLPPSETVGQDELAQALCDVRAVVLVGGLGGNTASVVLPEAAKAAKEQGIFVVCLVTVPFTFEGKERAEKAKRAIADLEVVSDNLFVFENDSSILKEMPQSMTMADAFAKQNENLLGIVCDIAGFIHSEANETGSDGFSHLSKTIAACMGDAGCRPQIHKKG